MQATKTIRINPSESPDCWTFTVRIPKPSPFWAKVGRVAIFALSVGFNVGFVQGCAPAATTAPAAPTVTKEAPQAMCDVYAEQSWRLAGGDDAAWEDAYAACSEGEGTYEEAYAWSLACDSATAWVEPVPGMVGVYTAHCGNADGVEVF